MAIPIRISALVIILCTALLSVNSESYIPEVKDPQLEQLHRFIEENDPDALQQQILWEEAPADAADSEGRTLLHFAAYAGRADAARALIRSGASLEARDSSGRLPVHLARDPRLIDILSGGGRLLFMPDHAGTTAAKQLIETGEDLIGPLLDAGYAHVSSDDGVTLLHTAAEMGAFDAASLLLERQAYVNAAADDGTLPVDLSFTRPESTAHLRTAHVLVLHGSAPPSADAYRYVFDVFRAGTWDYRFDRRVSLLHIAAENDHSGVITYALDQGAYIEARDEAYRTALHTAAAAGHRDILELLLDGSADPAAQDAEGDTPLHLALRNHRDAEMIRILLRSGAPADASNRERKTPLHTAAAHSDDAGITEMLFEYISSPDAEDIQGRTALLTAVTRQAYETARVLTARGSDIHAEDLDGNAPVTEILLSSPETLSRLLSESHILDTDRDGNTLVHLAASAGAEQSVIELLLSLGAAAYRANRFGDTPLHLALKHGRCAAAELLISHGADPFRRTDTGLTAFELAFRQGAACTAKVITDELLYTAGPEGETPLLLAARGGFLDICADLLDRGAEGESAVHIAARRNDVPMLQLFIWSSVPLEGRNETGNTPLHEAALHGATRAARLLLLAGAFPNARNDDGNTPMHLAVEADDPQMIRTLHEFQASLDIRNSRGMTPLLSAAGYGITDSARQLASFSSSIHAADPQGNSPLHGAVLHRDRPLVIDLIHRGADIHARNRSGETPLTLAVKLGPEQVTWLMETGAVMRRDHAGNTPLHIAVSRHASRSTLERMIKLGSSVDSRNNHLETPLHLAVLHLHREAAEVLITHGADIFMSDSEGVSVIDAALNRPRHTLAWILGQEVSVTDEMGNTPLHYAVEHSNADAVIWLLDRGADPLKTNSSGITPADAAEGTELEEILRLYE